MDYLLHGLDRNGDPVSLPVSVCWRCGTPVVTSLVSMDQHTDREHPLPPEDAPRHALVERPELPPGDPLAP